jgi:hypothetical protein
MRIKLSPLLIDKGLVAAKDGQKLILNGVVFDFSQMKEGDVLPRSAIDSEWFAIDPRNDSVQVFNGELVLMLTLPIPENYSQEQAFPVDLVNVPDGIVVFPQPLPVEGVDPPEFEIPAHTVPGVVDWSKLVTQEMKGAAALADHLSKMKAELAARNAVAAAQILRIQDRIETIGYGIDAGEATENDLAEQDALLISLKAWKTYKFSLGKVTAQPTWHAAPVWPTTPAIPDIDAAPMGLDPEQV